MLTEVAHRRIVGPRVLVALCLGLSACQAQPPKVLPVDTSRQEVNRRQASVAYVLSLSVEEMLALVPEQSGIYFTDCPHCDTGSQDRADWQWDPRQPHRIVCKGCGEIYPDNPRYPDDRVLTVAAPGGVHRYPYYQARGGRRYFFRATADYFAAHYMAQVCQDLAELFHITGREDYARRAVLILERFAEVYPGYAYKYDYPFQPKRFAPYTQNRIPGVAEYRTSRWHWWAYHGISRELFAAYDGVRFWPGLSPGVRRKIERDLLGAMVRFVMGFKETYSNMSPGMWADFIMAGRILDRPEWIREALDRADRFLSENVLYDGAWKEPAPSYAAQVIGTLERLLRNLEGFEPPESAAPENRWVQDIQRIRTRIKGMRHNYAMACRPDGYPIPINDTWAKPVGPFRAERLGSRLLPGLGLAVLEGGRGRDSVCAWLDFTSGTGHKHRSDLSIGLIVPEGELLSDIGYTHTAWRAWTTSTMSHNTVVVDGLESQLDADHTKHEVLGFVTWPGFSLVEVESRAAYPGRVSRYRRTLACVSGPEGGAYLVDVFQVRGGRQHDYLLHGTPAGASTIEVDGPALAPFAGSLMNRNVRFVRPTAESQRLDPAAAYGFVQDLRTRSSEGPVHVAFRLKPSPRMGLDSHIVSPTRGQIYVGSAPRIRPAERNDRELPRHQGPFFCYRVPAGNLPTVFTAVHEPVHGQPRLRAVRAYPMPEGMVIQIDHRTGWRDVFFMRYDTPGPLEAAVGGDRVVFDGRWGLARLSGQGKPAGLYLVGGRRMACDTLSIESAGAWSGTVTAVGNEAREPAHGFFELDQRIDPAQAGGGLLVTLPDGSVRAYTAVRMIPSTERTRIEVAERVGLQIRGPRVEMLDYPRRRLPAGPIRYHLWAASQAAAPGRTIQ